MIAAMSTSPENGDNPTQSPKPQPMPPLLLMHAKGGVAGWSQTWGFAALAAIVCAPLGVIVGTIAILLAVIAILRRRWGKEAFNGLMGGAVGLVSSVLILSIVVPGQIRGWDEARRIYCSNNASIISRAVNAYTSEGKPAPSQPALFPSDYDKPWRCARYWDLAVGYFYFPPAVDAPTSTIIVCDYFANHKDTGRAVGYLDGSSKWRTEQEFQQELQRPENRAFAEALRQSPLEQRR